MATGFKEKLIRNLRAQAGLSHRDSAPLIDVIFDSIKFALQRHEEVSIEGFGTFKAVRNPDPRRAWKFGQVTTIHAQPYKVVFEEEV